jgi:sarcosine oxidase subunit beta
MQNYSALSLLRHGLTGHRGWRPAWGKARLKPAYDAVIVGGGGHGLATAYYLAKMHGLRRVALLEKGWIGGGNTGRNTTAVRSNYFYPESVALYDLALRLYEGLSRELNYNVMLSQRGMLIAAHTPAQMEICTRIANAMQLNGVDGSLMGAAEAVRRMPLLNQTADARFRCLGGVWQGRAGVARHDAVAWGYARAASGLGSTSSRGARSRGSRRRTAR